MQNTRSRENREKRNGEKVREPGSHKSPTATGVRQTERVSKLFLGAQGKGRKVANQPL